MKSKRLLLIMLVAFIIIGCNAVKELSDPSPTPTITPTPPIPNLAEILQIANVRSLRLKDDWSGLPDYGPAEAHYFLQPKGKEFVGAVTFRAGEDLLRNSLTDTEEISIPATVVQSFLNTLAKSQLQDIKYELTLWTDDYPYLEISIELQDETIEFYSEAQGEFHAPWAVTFRNKTYVINSIVPMQALTDDFGPYLKKEKLAQLIDNVFKNFDATETSQPIVTP